jgi:signal transduction histidine kinase
MYGDKVPAPPAPRQPAAFSMSINNQTVDSSRSTRRDSRRPGHKEIAAGKVREATLRRSQRGLEGNIEAQAEQLRLLSAMLIEAQDRERRQLARELHDSAGQYLAAIQMNLSAIARFKSDLNAQVNAKIVDSIALVTSCSSEIRTISYLLHPPLLDEMGLRVAVMMYVEGFSERSNIRVDLQIPDALDRLPGEVETVLFRVIQQSLANVHRHSSSPVARIVVKRGARKVTVKIADEGRGITPETLSGFRAGTKLVGVGMAGMRERVRRMAGQFDITSSKKGTTIQVTLPL